MTTTTSPPRAARPRRTGLLACLSLLVALTACTDPITVGQDLLVNDLVEVGQITDLPVETRTVAADPLLSWDASERDNPNANANVAQVGFFGQLEDEVFGRWTQGFYLTPSLPLLNGLPAVPSFVNQPQVRRRVDSVVIIMTVDTTLDFYGPGRLIPVRVDQLTEEPVDTTQDIFTDVELPVIENNIAAFDDISASRSGRLLYDTVYTSTGRDSILRPHLRIRLSTAFVEDFVANVDSTDFASEAAFRQFFGGVRVLPTATSNSLIPIRPTLNNQTLSGIQFFYKNELGNDTSYLMRPELFLPTYERDFTGSVAGDLLADDSPSQAVTALAGQGALLTEIRLTDLSALEGKIINRAQLTFPALDIDNYDETDYPLPEFTALFTRDQNGVLVGIEDQLRLNNGTTAAVNLFLGGNLVTTDADEEQYSPNLTVQLQEILRDPENFSSVLYLRALPVQTVPARALLAGSAGADRAVRFTVTFTESD